MGYPYDSSPAEQAVAVTTSDTVGFAECRALYIGTAGNVVPVLKNGGTPTFKNVAAGTILPVRCTRVNATSTTAADIVALY